MKGAGKPLKYEVPELTVLKCAISAVQGGPIKCQGLIIESITYTEVVAAYEDWE